MRKTRALSLLLGGLLAACSGMPSTATQRMPMPIETIDVLLMESLPVQGAVHVRGYLPDSCHFFVGSSQRREGNTFVIEMEMERRAGPNTVCLMRIELVERTIPLGTLAPGDYVVSVNGVRRTFQVS